MIDLGGRRALVMGVANDRSIGWGIAESLARGGAETLMEGGRYRQGVFQRGCQ